MHVPLLFLFSCLALSIASNDPSPTCALNYPCPPPTWPVTWQLNLSTICQPGNMKGYFVPPADKIWGLVSLDWSTAEGIWLSPNRNLSTCEATSIENGRRIKAVSPGTRVFIYHNMELALQWIESQRAVMYDPTKANWFLQYTDGKGNKNGTIYNERRLEGDQFFWDFRVPEAADYFISSILQSVSSPYVDGTFTDDVTGIPAEHPEVAAHCKLSPAEEAAIQIATQKTSQRLIDTLIRANKYNWQAFSAGDGVSSSPDKGSCLNWMRQFCQPMYQSYPMAISLNDVDQMQVTAAFLITRPPYGWLGYGWESDMDDWRSIFDLDVGEPVGLCVETEPGYFERKWTKGVAGLDCNTWTPHLLF